jgi:predicted Zn-dependent protease
MDNPFKVSIVIFVALFFSFGVGVNLSTGAEQLLTDGIRLPDLGSPSDQYLTPNDEVRLGQAFMQNILETQAVVTDPLISEYIQNLGNRLLKHSEAAGHPYHFFVIEEPVINAFAGPGGHIGIFSGLILATQSESELASVIAHEIAHVTQKHLLRAFDEANKMSGKTAALILAAILVGMTTSSPDAGIAMATGVQASAIQQQINFTRSNEQEADNVGIRILADADFDPRAMPASRRSYAPTRSPPTASLMPWGGQRSTVTSNTPAASSIFSFGSLCGYASLKTRNLRSNITRAASRKAAI